MHSPGVIVSCLGLVRSRAAWLPAALAFALLLSFAHGAAAQTINPRTVSFVPSPDHDVIGADGQPVVTRYDLEFFPVGASQSLLVLNLGKPAAGADGYISVDFASMLASPPAPGQQLEARVSTVGPAGSTNSSPSNQFSFDCSASVSPTNLSGPSEGGTGSIAVTIFNGCPWQATTAASWITITGGASGSGNGTVTFSTPLNTSTSSRIGTIAVAGQTVTVTQAGAAASNVPPTVQVTSPASGSNFTAPATIAIAATAADGDGTVSSVAFYANGTLLGTVPASPYTVSWANVAAGTYTITAVATDNSGAKTTSGAISVTVRKKKGRR